MKKSKAFLVIAVVTLSLGIYGCYNPWANKDTNDIDSAIKTNYNIENSFSLYND